MLNNFNRSFVGHQKNNQKADLVQKYFIKNNSYGWKWKILYP